MRSILPLLLLVALVATPALAGPDTETRPLAIGEDVTTFTLTDLSGTAFDLAKAREITEASTLAEALAAAKAVAGGAELSAETPLASLSGLQGEDGADAVKVRSLLQSAGLPYGLIPSPEAAEMVETVGDIAEWLMGAAEAPIVFMCWSPMCPTSRGYETRLQAVIAETGARFYPLASNSAAKERDEDARDYVAQNGLPYRVLLDRDQVACDVFGGKVTPHVFVVDANNRLAYAGSIDNDARQSTKDADERQNWLQDAVEALMDGRPLDVMLTRGKG